MVKRKTYRRFYPGGRRDGILAGQSRADICHGDGRGNQGCCLAAIFAPLGQLLLALAKKSSPCFLEWLASVQRSIAMSPLNTTARGRAGVALRRDVLSAGSTLVGTVT